MPRVIDELELKDFLKKTFPDRLEIAEGELETKIIERYKIISTQAIRSRIRAMIAFGYLTKVSDKVYRIKERENATSEDNK